MLFVQICFDVNNNWRAYPPFDSCDYQEIGVFGDCDDLGNFDYYTMRKRIQASRIPSRNCGPALLLLCFDLMINYDFMINYD